MPPSDVPYAFMPWYACWREMMIVLLSLPWALQKRRASLQAVSTASEPPEPKNTAPSL